MNYELAIPLPVKHKITGFNLDDVTLEKILEKIDGYFDSMEFNARPVCHTFELHVTSHSQPVGCYVRCVLEKQDKRLLVIDIDIDVIDGEY